MTSQLLLYKSWWPRPFDLNTPWWKERKTLHTTTSLGHFWSLFQVYNKIWRSQRNTQCGELSSKTWHSGLESAKVLHQFLHRPVQGSWNFAFYAKCTEWRDMCPSLTMWWTLTPCGIIQPWKSCNFLRGPVCCDNSWHSLHLNCIEIPLYEVWGRESTFIRISQWTFNFCVGNYDNIEFWKWTYIN